MQDEPRYEIDQETQDYLEALLNLGSIIADAQLTDQACEDVYSLLNTVADRFYIEHRQVNTRPPEPANNTGIEHLHKRPNFRVVIDNTEDDKDQE